MTRFCLLIFRIVSAALAKMMDQAGRLINERKQPAGSRRRSLRLGWLYILTASIIALAGIRWVNSFLNRFHPDCRAADSG
jgi:hypothetical protein